MFSCQSIALAGDRGAVEFVVYGIMVVDEALVMTLPLAGFSNACAQASQLLSVFWNQYSTTARRASVVNPLFHHALPMQ